MVTAIQLREFSGRKRRTRSAVPSPRRSRPNTRCGQPFLSSRHAPAGKQEYGAPPAPAILVVDDEPMIRKLLQLQLQQQGFGVLVAADGREALVLYQARRSTIALVLLDVRMPDLDGPQTLAALRQCD